MTSNRGVALDHAILHPLGSAAEWTVASSYHYCRQIAERHYENFPVGSVLIPKRLRKHFYAIYAFARAADDFADEGYERDYSAQQRIDLIEEWRRLLRASLSSPPRHPVFVALSETIRAFDLPITLFEDLLSAFAQDVVKKRYESLEELIDYCRRSANPVGRLILSLFRLADEEKLRWSDSLCTGLQLANHWQDVAIDLDKDRIYIPLSDLKRFGSDEAALRLRVADSRFKSLMRFEVERAREFFMQGKPLCLAVSGRLALELRAVWLGGWRILERIEQNDYDVFTRRLALTSADRRKVLWHALSKGRFRRY